MLRVKLKELLQENNTTIAELSEATGINRRPLTQLANNESKMVKFDTLDRIKNYFHLDRLDDLFIDEEMSEITFSPQPLENNQLRMAVDVAVKSSRESTPILESFIITMILYKQDPSHYYLSGCIDDRFDNIDSAITDTFKKLHPMQIQQFIKDFGSNLLSFPYTTESTAKFRYGMFPYDLTKQLFSNQASLHISVPELNISGDLIFNALESHKDVIESLFDASEKHEWFHAKFDIVPDYSSVFSDFNSSLELTSISISRFEDQ